MFRSIYEVRVEGNDIKRFIKKLYRSNIYIEDLEIYDKCAYFKLTKENYEKLIKIKTIYKVEVTRLYGIIKLVDIIKRNYFFIVGIIISYIYLLFLSNVIFDVEVIHSKKEIRDLLYKELNNYGIKKYNMVKSYKTKENIEKKILEDNKDKLEWLEIEKSGVKYKIKVEERVINSPKDEELPHNVVAKKDGIILKIQASKGEVRKKVNDYVKKGDIIISGLITKGEEIKNQVPAEGVVYAEVWYKTKVNMPYYYREERKTGKSKKTIKFSFLNKDFYIFNFDKYKSYKQQEIFGLKNNLLPIGFSYSKEYETIVSEHLYSPEEAVEAAISLSNKKLEENFTENERIISSRVLSTTEYENYISVEIFYKIFENITEEESIIIPNEENKEKN